MKQLLLITGLAIAMVAAPQLTLAQQTLEEATDSLKAIKAQADAGDATSQNIVGTWYYAGKHVHQDYRLAAQYWAKAAKQNHTAAIGNLGMCYQMGRGVEKDSLRAVGLYTRSIKDGNKALLAQVRNLADQGILFSCVYTAYAYQNGIGDTKSKENRQKALEYYVKAAAMNSVDAQREGAVLALNLGQDATAAKLAKQGADNKDMACIFWYGKLLHEGKGITKDAQLGFDYLLRAAEADHAMGQYEVAKAYLEGNGVTKSADQGITWLTKAANNDVSNAQYLLARCFVSGEGVDVDFDQAALWFAVCLPAGHGTAFKKAFDSSNAGEYYGTPFHAYLKGLKYYSEKDFDRALEQFKAVEKAGFKEGKTMQGVIMANNDYAKYNLKKGIKALTKAAEESAMAAYLLGGIYEAGKGVDKDIKQALTYLRQAADAGYTPAICYLGDMYYEGRGVDKSHSQAVEYYLSAKALLTSSAAKRLAECYENGYGGLTVDAAKAEQIRKKEKTGVVELLKLIPMN